MSISTNFNYASFIIMDKNVPPQRGGREVSITVSEKVIYPMETTIPVINSREGRCIGLGYVNQLIITPNSTTIKFLLTSVAQETASVLYNLYRNSLNNGGNSVEDTYDTDGFVPGAMFNTLKPKKSESTPKRKGYSLSDIFDNDNGYDDDLDDEEF